MHLHFNRLLCAFPFSPHLQCFKKILIVYMSSKTQRDKEVTHSRSHSVNLEDFYSSLGLSGFNL